MSPDSKTSGVESTRTRILDYLHEHPVASVSTLSKAWGLTRADIRYHLNMLSEEGLIELVPRDAAQPARRGRPAQTYRLSAQAAPNNLPALCHVLLSAYLDGSQEPTESRLRALAERLAQPCPPSANLTRRLSLVVEVLSRYAYRPRWEAGAQGPRILLRTCPYAAILSQHPELCQMDRYLLEILLQMPLRQTARLNALTGHPPACVFTAS